MDALEKAILPADVQVVVTRNYGVTANDKVTELEEGLFVAVAVVMALLAIGLGYRQALVVAIAVPCVFGLTLIVNYFLGFSINRISLFALTVALGLLVDDPIVDVENIHRHLQLRGRATADIVLEAVNEVRPPLIAATFAVILSFLPLLFVTDMMGQYLRPMAANVPVTMIMSLVVSFTITPWLAYKLLRGQTAGTSPAAAHGEPTRARRFFDRTLTPLLARPWLGRAFLLLVLLLFVGSVLLVLTRRVQVKQLPYDNKDEMLLVLDLPAGTTLERTDAAARDFERYLASVPEITDFEAYVGTASPVDFNGLMRQYFLRRAPNRADIRINLIHKTERASASHSLALRMRGDLTALAQRHGVKLKIVELPAGPPAMSTVVAAVYGSATNSYQDLMDAAAIVKARMRREPGVVDVDDTVEEDQTKYVFDVDRQKAAINGISTDDVARAVALALGSQGVGAAQVPHERTPVRIALWFPRADRSSPVDLSRIYAKSATGHMVPVSELGGWRTGDRGQDDLSPPARACGLRPRRDGGPAAGGDDPRPHGRRGARPSAPLRGRRGATAPAECPHDVSQGRRHRLAGARRRDGSLVGRGRDVHHDPPLPRSRRGPPGRVDRHLHHPDEPDRLLRAAAHHDGRHPAHGDRRHAGILAAESVRIARRRRLQESRLLLGPGVHRHDRAGGHRHAELDHHRRLHSARAAARPAARTRHSGERLGAPATRSC